MTTRRPGQDSVQDELDAAVEKPSHPKLAASLLMIGIVAFLIVISLVPLI